MLLAIATFMLAAPLLSSYAFSYLSAILVRASAIVIDPPLDPRQCDLGIL
jgi:hypothetical protein